MNKVSQKLTLYQPETYQIKVPGELGESWSDWAGVLLSAFGLVTYSIRKPHDFVN